MEYVKIPLDIQQKTIELYISGKSSIEICKVLPISTGSVFNILKKHGIPSKEAGFYLRTNFFNERCFQCLNDESAYWLGFAFADGCVRRDNYTLRIALSSKDRGHLEKFAKFLGGSTVVKDIMVRVYPSCSVTVGSKQMFNDLMTYGCHPKKSLTLKWPEIPDEYFWHFLRGYFDGDGSVSSKFNRIDIVSSYEFIDSLGARLSNLGFNCKYHVQGKVKYLMLFGVTQLREFAKLLYKDSSVFLERKKLLFDSKKQVSIKEQLLEDMALVQSLRGLSYKELCKKTGFSHNHVHHMIKCLNKREKAVNSGNEQKRDDNFRE